MQLKKNIFVRTVVKFTVAYSSWVKLECGSWTVLVLFITCQTFWLNGMYGMLDSFCVRDAYDV